MKKILFALCLLGSVAAMAQEKFNSPVKKGSKFSYTLFTGGQNIPFTATVDSLSSEYVKIGWNIEGIGTGGWIMKKKSLESATHGYWSQPTIGTDEELGDDMTVLLLSKAQWNSIQQDKKFTYNEQVFTAKEGDQAVLKAGAKTIVALLFEGPGGTTRLWVLNNPDFPALLKVEGNGHGVDLELTNIE